MTTEQEHTNTVELIGFYGGDITHACSAWTSTSRDLDRIEPKTGKPRRDRIPAVLKMLAQENPQHTSPFEKSALHFLLRTDKATHIHIIKHRIAVSVNAESARYKELQEDFWFYPTDWPTEAEAKQDGLAAEIREGYCSLMESAHSGYHSLLDMLEEWYQKKRDYDQKTARKRAKETARFVLPHASQVQQDVQFNFLSFTHFLKLRNHPHAQLEVRDIASAMLEIVRNLPGQPFQHSLAAWGY